MNIVLFGATGQTGKIFLKLALEKGHNVTAVVRDISKVNLTDKNLTVKTADLFNKTDLIGVIKGNDLVVSCLGGNANNKSTLLADMITNIVGAMKECGVSSMYLMSSAGIHNEMPGIIAKIFVALFFKNAIADHKIAAEALINSGFTYLIVRPLSLVDGEMTKTFRTSDDSVPKAGSNISRQDVAWFLAECLGKSEYRNKSICLCY